MVKKRRFQRYLTIKEEDALYQLLWSLRFFGLYLLIIYAIGLALLIE